ncbi:MAG: ABC transporter ATP-binding protein [Deltaproteobacteria bacterium]|nr:ABC transporter ATP-binding protein [Deltaproteobacteria bacterium]
MGSEADVTLDPVTGEGVAIRYVDVHKAFGDHQVLRGLSLAIPRGRITAIIGRSGTGKSVTIKHVMGLLRPDRGKVWVGADELTSMSDRQLRTVRNRFGLVFQNAALFDSMSVFDNIAFPLREHARLPRAKVTEKVREMLALVGVHGAEDRLPSELSGGMRKRVGLARALVRDPEFLLYDEPTTGLDPILTAAIDELIVTTHHARPVLTSVVISHDMRAVLRIADKVVMLVDGAVAHEGTPDYFHASTDPLVVQFLTGSLDGPMKV